MIFNEFPFLFSQKEDKQNCYFHFESKLLTFKIKNKKN